MKEYQSLSHTRWDCKYHIVFIPKKRKQRIFGMLHKKLGEIFHQQASGFAGSHLTCGINDLMKIPRCRKMV